MDAQAVKPTSDPSRILLSDAVTMNTRTKTVIYIYPHDIEERVLRAMPAQTDLLTPMILFLSKVFTLDRFYPEK